MSDTERLLDASSDADGFERDLLGSLRDVSPPAGAKDETWSALAVQIAAAGAVGTAAGKAAGSVAARALAAKIAIGVGVAVTAIGAGVFWPRPAPRAPAVAAPPIAAPAPVRGAPAEPAISDRPAPAAEDQPLAAATPRAAPRSSESADTPDPLGRESAIVTEARAELKAGDPRAALATLARLRTGGHNAVLVQEREVITIQALAATGDGESARRRAKAFLAAYPNSPHTPQLRRIADAP